MINIIIVVVLVILLVPAVRASLKFFKGKCGCCGGSESCCAESCGSSCRTENTASVMPDEGGRIRKFSVKGMSCAACSARVEKAVSALPGIESVSVNLLTNTMGVTGSASDSEIIKTVKNAGYGAKSVLLSGDDESLLDAEKETGVLRKRFLISLVFLLVLMYFSMGRNMLSFPVPELLSSTSVLGTVQMIFSAAVIVINRKFFINGFKGFINRSANMDTLVALGSGTSFLWSTAVLVRIFMVQKSSGSMEAEHLMHGLYFESAAMILTLITVGKMLESYSKGKTTSALKALMKLAPKTAVVIRAGKEITIPAEQIVAGDVFLVRPGESIPVDGIVLEGSGAVNEAAITGESIPADKKSGDSVVSASINMDGFLKCRALRVGRDTTLSRIIQMVGDAAATKAPVARIADKVSAVFVPSVIAVAAVTFAVWLLLGKDAGFALSRAISVLVISCPCALGLATPVAIMVGSGVGARHGILFKTAAALEKCGGVSVIAMDKTGTITKGTPEVTQVECAAGITEELLLQTALDVEEKSEHPVAKAVVEYARNAGFMAQETHDFKAVPGKGVSAVRGDKMLFAGTDGDRIVFKEDGLVLGYIKVMDTIKADSASAIADLKRLGIKVFMITGDNKNTAALVAEQSGVDGVYAEVMPDKKAHIVEELKLGEKKIRSGTGKKIYGGHGFVAMVGDGINDAPSLAACDVGMAVGAGTDIAIDSADVVLMKSSIADVVMAVRLSRATVRNIRQNLFWAFFYNIICIPLAAGAYTKLFGWSLNPMVGAAAMSLSSFCVVMNALRLNFVKIGRHEKEKSRTA